ncbi:hypothetical protein C0989_005685 [Termitomyces sp. Mn162]|nr:hypothetical protein C0989_005685 [Termitomyces sp. Mn162]
MHSTLALSLLSLASAVCASLVPRQTIPRNDLQTALTVAQQLCASVGVTLTSAAPASTSAGAGNNSLDAKPTSSSTPSSATSASASAPATTSNAATLNSLNANALVGLAAVGLAALAL